MLKRFIKSNRLFLLSLGFGGVAGVLLSLITAPAAPAAPITPAPITAPVRYDAVQDRTDYGQQFEEVIDKLRANHVNVEGVKSKAELFKIAIDAILRELGDKNGRYYSSDGFAKLQEQIRPTAYTGVAIQIAPTSNGVVILQIFDNSPLNGMNIKVGDVITAAGSLGEPMTEWDSDAPDLRNMVTEMVAAIKGGVGTDVNLKIKRGNIDLGIITVPRVTTRNQVVYMKQYGPVLIIRITQFTTTVSDDIIGMLYQKGLLDENHNLDTTKVRGVVLDLRFNPGGVLGQAIRVSDMFLPEDTTAVRVIERPATEGGRAIATDYQTEQPRLFPKTIPRVILVNKGSASASEIVSGAVQVHEEGIVLGTKTYGKGSVQSIIPLPGGSGIKMTTAIYLAGGTKMIDGVGVTPDSQVLQPRTVGLSNDDRRMNEHIIRISMDPTIDHQLNVAQTYIMSFITGGFDFQSTISKQKALNKAHGAKTFIDRAICQQKGLRGCKQNGPSGGTVTAP